MVEPPEGKTLVSWGTPKVQDAFAATAWPRVYRERNEIQENGFKRMIAHGALNTNYGRKTIVGIEGAMGDQDRKSTRLNSSHLVISYAVFCLKKKKKKE